MANNRNLKLKDLLPYNVRVVLGKSSRLIRYSLLLLSSGARKQAIKHCRVCSRDIAGFVHGGKLCPFCTSFPRHRALLPLIEKWLEFLEADVKLLHVAPDACMRQRLIKNEHLTYMGIDRFTPGHSYPPATIHGDIENLDLEDESQDLVICLHVLEHVDDDRRSLSEMRRVLKPGGIAVLAFPFLNGELTYEDPTIVSPAERNEAFGQWGHVRLFGEDVAERMSEAGFKPKKITPQNIWNEQEIACWGLLPKEVFFLCKKPGSLSSLSNVAFK